MKMSVIDLDTMKLVGLPLLLGGVKDMISADSIQGVPPMFILERSGRGMIRRVNLQTGIKSDAVEVPRNCQGLARSDDALYTLNEAGTELLTFAIPEVENVKTLTIVSALGVKSGRMVKATELFHEKYPDVEVKQLWMDDVREQTTQMLAGAKGYDIIHSQEQNVYASAIELYRAGAIVDPSQCEKITGYLPEYLDMFASLSVDGRLIAVPNEVYLYSWKADEKLAETVGIDIPEDTWTWDDFFAMAEKLEAYNEANGTKIQILNDPDKLMPYFLAQYNTNTIDIMNGTANYTDVRFIELLNQWRTLNRRGMVSYYEPSISKINAVFQVNYWTNYYDLALKRTILPPVVDESTRYPVNIFRMVINANSPYREEAAYFLACYMDPEAILTEELEVRGQMLKDAERYKRYDSYHAVNITEESMGIWRRMLVNSAQDYFVGDLHREQLWTLYPALMEGEITAEEFARRCQDKEIKQHKKVTLTGDFFRISCRTRWRWS